MQMIIWHLEVIEINKQYKECVYAYRKFRKTVLTTRTILQDQGIEELVLYRHGVASVIRLKIKNLEVVHSQRRKTQTMLGKSRGTRFKQDITIDPATT